MDSRTYGGAAGTGSRSGALALVAGLARRVAAEPESLEDGLRELVPALVAEFELEALVLEVGSGDREIRISRGETCDEKPLEAPLEVPIFRGRLRVGRMLASPKYAEEDLEGTLAGVADVVSLAVSTAESYGVASRRAAQSSVIQLASEALSRTLDEGQIYRTVLALAIDLLDSRAGVILAGGEPVAVSGFTDTRAALEALEALEGHEPPGRRGWRRRVVIGLAEEYALGVSFGGQEGSIFLLREGKPYRESDAGSLRLVARQLSHARERGQLHASLERRDLEAILALSAALESRDGTTGEHIDRTQRLAGDVARELGLGPDESRTTRYAAILHDIGKIGVPDAILNKPAALSGEEWEIMRRHPEAGANILASIAGFESVSEAVLTHHERFDGGGYPAGLSGSRIPAAARIISVVDAYDAMTNDRPYRRAMSHEEALRELERGSGTQFDPRVVESVRRVVERDPSGARRRSLQEEEAR